MKKIFTLLLFLFVLKGSKSNAQDYKESIGLRCGWTSGITGKFFISDGRAVEGIVSSGWGWSGFQITGLYEFHKAAFKQNGAEGFYWFYGAGAHIGGGYKYYTDEWVTGPGNNGYWQQQSHDYFTFGIDGIFGIEYKIQELPVTLAVDVKPFLEFSDYSNYPFHFWDAAFTIRYVIK